MTEVTLASASEKQVWLKQYFGEYVRQSGFLPYMGKAPSSIIVAKHELQGEAGKTINIPLILALNGDGVSGSATLDGAEEDLGNYNCALSVDWRRNGVRIPKSTSYKTDIDLFGAAKEMLREWESTKLREDVIKALASVVTTGDTTVDLADSDDGARNAYAAGNADRLLFGKLKSNYSATWATALGNLDTTDDKCTAASMKLAKRMARAASPKLRPFKTKDGREYFVAFHGSRTFRDLSEDNAILTANRDARAREGDGVSKNPLFQGGNIDYDGVIHVEIPEIDDIVGAGDYNLNGKGGTTADVRPVFLCGAQAVGVAWGQEPTMRQDTTKDYAFRPGVAVEELLRVKKLAYNGKQHGVFTAFFAAGADT